MLPGRVSDSILYKERVMNYSTAEFEEKYTYTGNDLGATWSEKETNFRAWAPLAEKMILNLYKSGTPGVSDLVEQIKMEPDVNGTWVATKEGNLDKVYYTYTVTIDGKEAEACDPYARTTGVNGKRAMVMDLSAVNPEGWEQDVDPNAHLQMTDAVIYELHVRDLSSHESAGISHVGKFLGIVEAGTKTPSGIPTGLDHMKELGITHLHLLPIYDYNSVDEAKAAGFDKECEEKRAHGKKAGLVTDVDSMAQFNWGYDPVNYNVPEGSYATDPFHGEVRVKEMKQMVSELHKNGISVIMDVVYNHVADAEKFCFNVLVPKYFSRTKKDGSYSDGSACGNDTASERSMVKKYIVDSVCYWADEYHIDGFRFDLVGLLDTETINAIVENVHKKHPNVIFYGEGWSLDTALSKEGYDLAIQPNAYKTPKFAYFNDNLRDGLKGRVFYKDAGGYVMGVVEETIEEVKACMLGKPSWCPTPSQTINYASCHDNYALMDKLTLFDPKATREEKVRRNNFAAAIYMLSQGVPFMHAGEELLRTKENEKGELIENSYNSSDYVNTIRWNNLEEEECQKTLAYYKGLIAFRKKYACLRLMTAEQVAKQVCLLEDMPAGVIGIAVHDEDAELRMFFNPNTKEECVSVPEGAWEIYVRGEIAGVDSLENIVDKKAVIEPISALVLVKRLSK